MRPDTNRSLWDPPKRGWLKLNTDGSSLGNPGESSYGGLIRNSSGEWICGYAGYIGYNTSLVSEYYGIMKGLDLIKIMGLRNVVIETDCETAFLQITVNRVEDSDPLSSMINTCKRNLVDLGCYMVHVRRDGNHCADLMARLGGKQEEQFVVYVNPPPELIPLIEKDASACLSPMAHESNKFNWDPPTSRWLKLNTDGISLRNSGESSYGGVLSNNCGAWVCGYAGNIGLHTSIGSKIYGIMMGLRLIKDKQLRNVVIETDCLEAFLQIVERSVDVADPLNWMIIACKRDMFDLGCNMVHVRRDATYWGRQMAKLGGKQNEPFVVYDIPPDQLIPLLWENANASTLSGFEH